MTLRNIHFLIYFLLEGFWKTGKNNNNNNFSTNTFLKIWLNPYMRSVGQIWSQNFNRAFFIRRSWIWHPKKLCKFEVIWQLVWQSMSSIVHSLENCPSIQYENVPLNPTLHGGGRHYGHYGPPPINFEAWQLKQQGLFWFNLHTNLVTWVPTMAKTQKIFLNVNSVWAMLVVTKWSKTARVK